MSQYRKMHNRHGLGIPVTIHEPEGERIGTVVMVHGMSSGPRASTLVGTIDTYLKDGYGVLLFAATHGPNPESEGNPEYFTVTSLLEDLEDVIDWAREEYLLPGKMILMGHSLGSLAAGLYALEHPTDVFGLILVASVTDGEKSFTYAWTAEELDAWKQKGFVERGTGEFYHRIRWSHYHNRCAYTLLGKAKFLTMPVLLAHGTEDADAPGSRDLFKQLKSNKKTVSLHKIKGAGHSIKEDEHLSELNGHISDFLKTDVS